MSVDVSLSLTALIRKGIVETLPEVNQPKPLRSKVRVREVPDFLTPLISREAVFKANRRWEPGAGVTVTVGGGTMGAFTLWVEVAAAKGISYAPPTMVTLPCPHPPFPPTPSHVLAPSVLGALVGEPMGGPEFRHPPVFLRPRHRRHKGVLLLSVADLGPGRKQL